MTMNERADVQLLVDLELVVAYNKKLLKIANYDQAATDGLIEVEDDETGTAVWNPFRDSTDRFCVCPIETYGRPALREMVRDFFS